MISQRVLERVAQRYTRYEIVNRSSLCGERLRGGIFSQVDPSGSYFPWKATAIGKSATSAKTFLEKRYAEGLELEDAIHIALLTLKETVSFSATCYVVSFVSGYLM